MKTNILIEAALTGNQYCGHYHFCLNLGKALASNFGDRYNFCFLKLNNNNVFKRLKPLITVRYSIYKYLYRFFYRPKIGTPPINLPILYLSIKRLKPC